MSRGDEVRIKMYRKQSSVSIQSLSGALKAVILIGGPHVGELLLVGVIELNSAGCDQGVVRCNDAHVSHPLQS